MSQIAKPRQQLVDIRTRRQQIIHASTKHKLVMLDEEERGLYEAIASVERLESQARHSIPPSQEENDLWEQIRDLMRQEEGILRERMIPEKYVRADAVEHFAGDLQQRVDAFKASTAGLKFNQSHGARVVETRQRLDAEHRDFESKVKPLCLKGQKLHRIREQIKQLSARRDALKAERESKALASVK